MDLTRRQIIGGTLISTIGMLIPCRAIAKDKGIVTFELTLGDLARARQAHAWPDFDPFNVAAARAFPATYYRVRLTHEQAFVRATKGGPTQLYNLSDACIAQIDRWWVTSPMYINRDKYVGAMPMIADPGTYSMFYVETVPLETLKQRLKYARDHKQRRV